MTPLRDRCDESPTIARTCLGGATQRRWVLPREMKTYLPTEERDGADDPEGHESAPCLDEPCTSKPRDGSGRLIGLRLRPEAGPGGEVKAGCADSRGFRINATHGDGGNGIVIGKAERSSALLVIDGVASHQRLSSRSCCPPHRERGTHSQAKFRGCRGHTIAGPGSARPRSQFLKHLVYHHQVIIIRAIIIRSQG